MIRTPYSLGKIKAIAFAVLAGFLVPLPYAHAQKTELEDKAENVRKQLERRQRLLRRDRARKKGVEHNVSIIDEERTRLNKLLINTARRIQDGEAMLTRIELRLGELAAQEDLFRGSLAQRHGKIARLLASMQRIGRQPPPVIITQRQDALKMVRSAMLLGSLYPQLKNQADELASKLTELVRVTSNIRFERERLEKQNKMLQSNRVSIKKLTVQKKSLLVARKSQLANLQNLVKLHKRSVSSLSELISKLDKEIAKQSALGQYEKDLVAGKAGNSGKKTAFLNPGRIKPAIAFSRAKGALPMPVFGDRLRSFGAKNKIGSISQGIVIRTRAGAQVTAPSDGWVVYSGQYRSYGNLLIINAGGGYHVLLAGMKRIDVSLKQFVVAGEPVGVMKEATKNAKQRGGIKTAGNSAPSLYIEFRKKGRPINPDPWWGSGKGKV